MIHGVMHNVSLGTDINGNGVPDVLLWSGDTGSGSTTTAWLVELGPDEAVLLGSWQGFESGLLDVEKADGGYDVFAYEWRWDPNSRWSAERVPLMWAGREYVAVKTIRSR